MTEYSGPIIYSNYKTDHWVMGDVVIGKNHRLLNVHSGTGSERELNTQVGINSFGPLLDELSSQPPVKKHSSFSLSSNMNTIL